VELYLHAPIYLYDVHITQTHSVVGPDPDPSLQVVTPSVLSTIPFPFILFSLLTYVALSLFRPRGSLHLAKIHFNCERSPCRLYTIARTRCSETPYRSGSHLLHYLRVHLFSLLLTSGRPLCGECIFATVAMQPTDGTMIIRSGFNTAFMASN
jgi:hypothetical protein